MSSADGSILIRTKVDTGGIKKGTNAIQSGVGKINNSLLKLGGTIATVFSVYKLVEFGKTAIDVASKMTNAMIGLQSIIEGTGNSFEQATSFIDDYISDGLVPDTNAVTAYKNLLMRGYTTEQIEKVMIALKDSAAFGRQASLSLGDAVQSATEGLKNENSILVDNAGVTKNVSKMWEDYAASIGTTAKALTKQQKIQAEVNGILQETRFQTGDAAKVADTWSGKIAVLTFNWNKFLVLVGGRLIQVLTPAVNILNNLLTAAINLGNAMANIFGWETEQASAAGTTAGYVKDTASSQEDVADATNETNKALKKQLAFFDDINVLASESASGSGVGGSAGGVGMSGGGVIANDQSKKELTRFESDLIDFFARIRKAIEPMTEVFKKLWNEGLSKLANFTFSTLKDFYNSFLVPIGKWTLGEGLPRFFNITNDLLNDINWGKLRTSSNEFYKVIAKFTKFVFTGVLDFYEHFLKPVATWTMSRALPKLLDTVTGLANHIKWNSLNKALDKFFKVLSKFTIGIGGGILNFFKLITPLATVMLPALINSFASALTLLMEAIDLVPSVIIEGVGFAIGTLATAVLGFKLATGIPAIITDIGIAISNLLSWIVAFPEVAVLLGIATGIGAIVAKVKEIDENMTTDVMETWSSDGSVAVGVLKDSFGLLVDDVTSGMQSMNEKISSISQTEESIDDTKQNIETIGSAIETGAYTVDEKVSEIKESFDRLLEDSTKIFSDEYDVIVEGLAGSLGDTLSAMGVAVPELTSLLRSVRDNAEENIGEIKQQMDDLDIAYQNGSISADDYGSKMLDLYGKLNSMLGDRTSVDTSISALDDLRGKLNFSEWVSDGTLDTGAMSDFFSGIEEIFNTGRDDIDTNVDGVKGSLQDFYDYANANHLLSDSELKTLADSIVGTETERSSQISTLQEYAGQVTDAIELELIGGINEQIDNAIAEYDNMNPIEKLLAGSQSEYVSKALENYQTNVIEPINTEMQTMFNSLGIDQQANASATGKKIIDGLFDEKVVHNDITGRRLIPILKSDWETILDGAVKDLDSAKFGKDTVDGYNKGITGIQKSSEETIKRWMSPLPQAIHDSAMNFGSPSKTAWDFGLDTILGFNNGISENTQLSVEAINLWGETLAKKLAESFGVPVWFEESVAPWFTIEKWQELGQGALYGISTKWDEFLEWWKSTGVPTWFEESVEPWFTVEKWKEIGKNMQDGIKAGFNGIVGWIVGILNKIIDSFESMVNFVVDGANELVDKFNSLPSAVRLGYTASRFDKVDFGNIPIPKLAQGAVLPPNKPFMSIVGDQKNGTNIEAPLETIKQALAEVMANYNSGGNGNIIFKIGETEVARTLLSPLLSEMSRQGLDTEVLGVV